MIIIIIKILQPSHNHFPCTVKKRVVSLRCEYFYKSLLSDDVQCLRLKLIDKELTECTRYSKKNLFTAKDKLWVEFFELKYLFELEKSIIFKLEVFEFLTGCFFLRKLSSRDFSRLGVGEREFRFFLTKNYHLLPTAFWTGTPVTWQVDRSGSSSGPICGGLKFLTVIKFLKKYIKCLT